MSMDHPCVRSEKACVAVIIGVNVVLYAVGKCARRFNPSPIHGFSMNLMFVECTLVSPKFRGLFIKLPSIAC